MRVRPKILSFQKRTSMTLPGIAGRSVRNSIVAWRRSQPPVPGECQSGIENGNSG